MGDGLELRHGTFQEKDVRVKSRIMREFPEPPSQGP
jgi:hypothetical protein